MRSSVLKRVFRAGITTLGLALVIPAMGTVLPLVNHGDLWRYHKGNAGALPADWKTTAEAKLAGSWLTGRGGFGYADNAFETAFCSTILDDMRGKYSTVAMRKTFEIPPATDPTLHLVFTMDWDDGFIAWIDGAYLVSDNSPKAPAEPPLNESATSGHESSRGDSSGRAPTRYDFGALGTRLAPGEHVLAIIGLNSSLNNSSDFIQVAELTLETVAPPPANCVGGLILTNSTWSASNSPVHVCSDVMVSSGATLTIEPGVAVYFESAVSLTVANGGALIAEGNENNRIRFTRNPDGVTAWGGITVQGEPGSPETRITYADIEFNDATAIHSDGGTVFLDHLQFGSAQRQYISLDNSSFVVSDCVFPSGVLPFELCHGTGGIKSGGHGLFLRNFFGQTLGYSDVVDFTGGQRPGPIVQFIDNVFSGSQDDGVDLDGTDAWVEGNIFLHIHRNGSTPDSSAGVSGGSNSGNTSQVTILGNLFFDCDNAVTAKQGNFYALINNTIVHTTRAGGIDGGSGVVNVRDTTPSVTSFARGCYLDANVVVDAEELVRNYDPAQTSVTLDDNLLPVPWTGPGGGNIVADPQLNHIPPLSETVFTNWAQAQIFRTWFALSPNSPARGTGPNGGDQGGVIPLGASISGEPATPTTETSAILHVGVNRAGGGIPSAHWPEGSGYTHYRWRLDNGAWSGEVPIASPITLTGLGEGPHYVEVSGKRDSGLYQDDPLLGPLAGVTRSRTWTVSNELRIERISITGSNTLEIQFTAAPNTGYTIEYRDSLSSGDWRSYLILDPVGTAHTVTVAVPRSEENSTRFYRIAAH